MGRKSKQPVKIDSSSGGTEVQPQDGLPSFKRFIDIAGKKREQKILTRLFFVTPTDEEVTDTVQMYQFKEVRVNVISGKMPYMKCVKITPPLFEFCNELGFSEDFSVDIVRLAINQLQGKYLSRNSIARSVKGLSNFVSFLVTRKEKPQTLTDINKEIWVDFLKFCVDAPNLDPNFNSARLIFHSYVPTSIGGGLNNLKIKIGKRRKILLEHTSGLAETRDYSDVVMYQLLSLFIFIYEQRIGYLKRYEDLTEAKMPQDWFYPGRKKIRLKRSTFDTSKLLMQWFSDEDAGYEILIDHFIMYQKAGLSFKEKCSALSKNKDNRALIAKFYEEMSRRHGYYQHHNLSLLHFYVKKKTATEANSVINIIGWCLANLLMMQTGVNKEVVLTIPSKAEDGKSILTRGDTVFVGEDGMEPEVNLYGIKAKTGVGPEKIVPIILVKTSPLYEMLVEYERYVKVSDVGPFFEFNNSFKNQWSTSGGSDISKNFPVTDENGMQLTSIDSTRLRKVFASGQLLDRMKNIKDMNDLAEKLRDDLSHGDLDTTINNYLLKSKVGRSVIDIAIATIIGGKLNDLKCKSQIELGESIKYKKKVFLCHCVDPHNPSHDVAIAEECRHYDLCLGCQQSTITKEHLPYICLRIIQYQNEREKDPLIWTATFEDKWCIANDALVRYIATDKKNGRRLVDEAWVDARLGRITLPPIISPTRM